MNFLKKFDPRSKNQMTLRPVKKHATAKRSTLSAYTKATLGSGNLSSAVKVPIDEDKMEWLAANTVDFFNEVSLLYGLVLDDADRYKKPGEGFPPGFEYRWASAKGKKPQRCSSPEYVEFVMVWVEDQVNNESIFPVQESQPFPDEFFNYVKAIFKRLFRVFAIVYHRHFQVIEAVEAAKHLNTCFKHFMFFCFEFGLLPPNETKALSGPVKNLQKQFAAMQ